MLILTHNLSHVYLESLLSFPFVPIWFIQVVLLQGDCLFLHSQTGATNKSFMIRCVTVLYSAPIFFFMVFAAFVYAYTCTDSCHLAKNCEVHLFMNQPWTLIQSCILYIYVGFTLSDLKHVFSSSCCISCKCLVIQSIISDSTWLKVHICIMLTHKLETQEEKVRLFILIFITAIPKLDSW